MSIGRRFGIFGSRACSASAPEGIVQVYAPSTGLAPAIYQVTLGSSGTPTDAALLFEMQRSTTATTGASSTTPTPLNGQQVATTILSQQGSTGDGTLTANTILGYWPLNQRATHRWDADPLGPVVGISTTVYGIQIWGVHASFTGAISANVAFFEW